MNQILCYAWRIIHKVIHRNHCKFVEIFPCGIKTSFADFWCTKLKFNEIIHLAKTTQNVHNLIHNSCAKLVLGDRFWICLITFLIINVCSFIKKASVMKNYAAYFLSLYSVTYVNVKSLFTKSSTVCVQNCEYPCSNSDASEKGSMWKGICANFRWNNGSA